MTPRDLVTAWRNRARELEPYAAPVAVAFEKAADELEAALSAGADAIVPLNDAARRSGYSPDHLGRMVRDGRLTNHGTKHRPRVRLGDLPRKAQSANVGAQ